MTLTEPIRLAADVQIVPVDELDERWRERLEADAGQHAVSRPRSRARSCLVGEEARRLLETFRQPTRFVDAVASFARADGVDPKQLFDDCLPLVAQLMRDGVLLGEHDGPVEAVLQVGDVVLGSVVDEIVADLDDTIVARGRLGAEHVAIKVARTNDTRLLESFSLEATVLTRLAGVGSPRLLASGDVEGRPVIVMDWVTGQPVGRGMDVDATVHVDRVRRVVSGVVEAYASLHERGVLHGDAHPGNILVDADGRVTLIDFGQASIDGAVRSRGGVPDYYEPESAESILRGAGPLPITQEAEQYAIATVLTHTLLGRSPIDAPLDLAGAAEAIVRHDPTAVELPASVADLATQLARARSARPGERFGSMREFADRVDRSTSTDLRRFERQASARLDMARLIDEIVAGEGVAEPGAVNAVRAAPTASVFYGGAGVALALAELAERCGRPEWLTIARAWAETAARSNDSDAFYDDAFFGPNQRPDARSFHHGPAGAHVAVATCAALQGDLSGLARAVDDIAHLTTSSIGRARATDTTIDSMVGPVSLLTGLCGLAELVEDTTVGPDDDAMDRQLARSVLAVLKPLITDGVARLDPSIVDRPIHGRAPSNLGAAHGWAGLLDAVMRSAAVTGAEAPEWVLDRADELSSFVELRGGKAFWPVAAGHPIAASGGWCNGSAGHVSVWCRRHVLSGDDRHLDLARSAVTAAASEPSPVHNLCCGSSGKVLAALTLFRATGEDRWLEEAETFLREADRLRGVQSPPMRELERVPRSVYKGGLGVALAAAALIDPDRPVRFFH